MKSVPRTASGIVLLSALATLTACGAPQPEEQETVTAKAQQAAQAEAEPIATAQPQIGKCDAAQVQSLVGQALTGTLSEQARQDANARSVRVLKPGQTVTMEFDGERLNLEVDTNNSIVSVRCG